MDQRLAGLKQWLTDVLDVAEFEIQPASADASFRRYFRVFASGESYIAMDAPPEKENSRPYIEVAQRLLGLGLNVPEILHHQLDKGYLLITDLGSKLYLNQLNPDTVERLYGDAMGALIVLQAGIFTDSAFLPDYDDKLLMAEMELFRDWYLGKHLGHKLTAAQHTIVDKAFERLLVSALEQPKVWVHRDYHSRNLLLTRSNNPGIIDFQDAVRGPASYDLVSLLRDCYIAWPRPQVEQWVKGYHQLALESGIPVCEHDHRFLQWFDRMGVQRHLKAIGIFARLNHRDGKPGYLNDIPRTLAYVIDVCGRYRELQTFHGLLRELGAMEVS